MKKLYYEEPFYNVIDMLDVEDLGELMIEEVSKGKYVVAALFYDEAKELLKELMLNPGVDVYSIDLAPECMNDYSEEYYVTLLEDFELIIEPAYVNGKYLCTDADILYVDGMADSKIVEGLDPDSWYELDFEYNKD